MASAARTGGVRPPVVAGLFYPAAAAVLEEEVRRLLAGVAKVAWPREAAAAAQPPAAAGRPKIVLVPHAGYRYSGPVAASAYAALAPWRGQVSRVVLLGPTHRVAVRGLAVPSAAAFATPLGEVPLDRRALADLARLPQVVESDDAHADEHALEVQLPFLQQVLGEFMLVPLAVGRAEPAAVAEVLERLWGGDETLVVISSDLSHYLPYDAACERDRQTIERVLRLDPDLDPHDACGAAPLAGALLAAARHGLAARLLDLRNSGDTAGDRRRVVGYASVLFAAAPGAKPPRRADGQRAPAGASDGAGVVGSTVAAAGSAGGPASAGEPTDAQLGAALIAHARHAIAVALGHDEPPAPADTPRHPALDEPAATFVTLRARGKLRGCIGALQARRPLRDDVRFHAVAAAFDDSRFPPLTAREFDQLGIEVSVLGSHEPIEAASEAEARAVLRPGVDGVTLEWRERRATLLPQVWESLPDAGAFLQALRHKAGLPAGFWHRELRLSRYQVRKFASPLSEEAL